MGPEPIENRSEMTGGVYIIKVELVEDKAVWRRIALRGGQTLHDLHMAVFKAFDREEAHLYSFYIPPKPTKSRSVRKFMDYPEYTHPYAMKESAVPEMMEMFETLLGFDMGPAPHAGIDAAATQIQSLKLVENQRMLYLFDFGDEWLHWITVEKIDAAPDDGKYPRILDRKGDSPPQYADEFDDDDDDWDDDDDDDWDDDDWEDDED